MSATTALPTGTWNVDPAHSHKITFQSSRSSPRTRTPTRSPVTGNLAVSDKIRLDLDVSAIKQARRS